MPIERTAVIDMGTNTFHLLLAEYQEGSLSVIFEEEVPVRLGKDGISEGRISTAAIQRALETLHRFKEKITAFGASTTRVAATSAFRNARNSEPFKIQIREELGLEVEVISGMEEARYIYHGVRGAGAIGSKEKVLIMDIGGGSVEFIIGDESSIFWKQSFEVGAQRLVDLFHKNNPISPSEIDLINEYLKTALRDLFHALTVHGPSTLIGASGTFETLVDIHSHQHASPAGHPPIVSDLAMDDYLSLHRMLTSLPAEKRAALPGMTAFRVDMIPVASCLIHFVVQQHEFKSLKACRYSLKEGLALGQ